MVEFVVVKGFFVDEEIVLVFISVDRESFFEFKKMWDEVVC